MKVTTKGQVTIPAHIRSYLGITPQSEVDFRIAENRVLLVKLPADRTEGPSRFARLRGVLKGGTTDQWMRETRGEE